MTETTVEIQAHIRETLEDLDADPNVLGDKVKSATDWCQHYRKSPTVFLAGALGGGVLLALATSDRNSYGVASSEVRAHDPSASARQPGRWDADLGAIKSALIGVVAGQAKNLLVQWIPDFSARQAETERGIQRIAP